MGKENCCQEHSGIAADIKNLQISDKKQWLAIEKLQNRLPVWATVVISLLTGITASALTYASLACRLMKG